MPSGVIRGSAHSGAADRALVVLVTVLWGLNFISARYGLESLTPWGFRAVTFGGGALLLVVLALTLRVPLRLQARIDYLHLLIAGAFAIAGFGVLSAISLLNTSVSRTSIVVYTMPIWVALFSSIFLRERLGARGWIAVALGIAGLGAFIAPVLGAGVSLGVIAALGAAVSWAIGTVYLKWAKVAAPALTVTTWQLLYGSIVSVFALGITGWHLLSSPMTPGAWAGIAYTMIAGTVAAYLIWFRVVQRLPANVAGLGTLLVPVFSTIVGVIWLGERLTVFDGIGFSLILIAGVLSLGRRPTTPHEVARR